MRRNNEEEQLQRAVIAQLEARAVSGLMWWHTPSGMKAGGKRVGRKNIPLQAIRMKRMGAKSGVPDLLFFYRSHFYALELKASGNFATAAQSEWMAALHDNGGSGCVCHDIDRAIRVLECWGLLNGVALVGGPQPRWPTQRPAGGVSASKQHRQREDGEVVPPQASRNNSSDCTSTEKTLGHAVSLAHQGARS